MGEGKKTAAERLRELADGLICDICDLVKDSSATTEVEWDIAHPEESAMTWSELLRDIAGQAEREAGGDADTTMSAYDLLSEREREILRMWPRFEDGEPVMPGNGVVFGDGSELDVFGVELRADGYSLYADDGEEIADLETTGTGRLKRPQPLDADGVPIREGDTVWGVGGGGPWEVSRFECGECVLRDGRGARMLPPDRLTHRRPEPPDSWESIERDCLMDSSAYARVRMGVDPTGIPSAELRQVNMRSDLVRRCRELAERGR